MKKTISLLLSIVMLLSMTAGVDLSAYADTSGDFEYALLDDGTAAITDYWGSATNLEIPSKLDGYTVTIIDYGAFVYCNSLTSITIPNSVTSIGGSAFNNCASLTSINVNNGNINYTSQDGVLFNKDKTALIQYPAGNTRTSYAIPNSVTHIDYYAFYNCTSMTSITIPDSVTFIGDYAFCGCSSLTNINVNNGNRVYASQDGVLFSKDKTELIQYPAGNTRTSYTIPDSVTSIGNYAFYGCSSLTSITIPDSVKSIGDDAFSRCSSLTSITIPNSVTSIGNRAFESCVSLTSITIPDGVTSIGDYAFYGCSSLTSITIPDGVTSIGDYAFYGCSSLTSITIPDGVKSIGDDAFNGCISLTSITIPDSVTSIGSWAFSSCTSLTSITIPDSVTSIDHGAFEYCESLTNVTIGNSVTSIGDSAFYSCDSLTNVTIGSSVTSIGDNAFSYCTSLTNINVNNGNRVYASQDGVLFNKDKTELVQYPEGNTKTSYAIPNSVTSIGNRAFESCVSLTSITIPDSVTSIGGDAFYNCTSLTSITIPDSVTNIGNYAFYGCSSLTSITIPDSVTSIGNCAFEYCESLTNVTIGNSVTSIGDDVFDGCSSLTSITIPDSVTSIGNCAFGDCTSLTSITIPDSVTSIGSGAFLNCYGLTDVYYSGTISDWNNISISSDNWYLTDATIHCMDGNINEKEPEHIHSYQTEMISPTCVEDGYTHYYCEQCGDAYNDDYVPATGMHAYVNGFCKYCQAKDADYAVPVIHNNQPQAVEIKNGGDCYYVTFTPTANGTYSFYSTGEYDTYGCLYDENMNLLVSDDDGGESCNFSITYDLQKGRTYIFACRMLYTDETGKFNVVLSVVSVEEHQHHYTPTATAPTCTEKGYTTYTCTCGDSYVDNYVPATGHNYTTKTTAPTCTENGYTVYTCSACNDSYTANYVNAAGHTPASAVTTKATTGADGTIRTTCSVCGELMSTAVIPKASNIQLSKTGYTYNGKVQKPGVTVKDSKGKTLKNGTDYTVSYANGRKNVGKYAVKVTFKGKYSGSKTLYFTITPKGTSLSKVTAGKKKFTVKWKKQTSQTTGYQMQYSTDKNFKKNKKTVTVTKNKTTSKTISKLKGKKKYYVRIRTYKTVKVNGKNTKIYSSWSKAKSIKTK